MKTIRIIIQLMFFAIFFVIIVNGKMFLWLALFLASFIGAFLFGRFYCGYLCPMNLVMAISGGLAKKLNWQTRNIPKFLKNKWLPWAILLLMAITMILWKRVLSYEIPIPLILLVFSAGITLRYEEEFFHNHICPYGVLLRLSGRWAKYSIKVDGKQCVGCRKCETVCHANAIEFESVNKIATMNKALCHQCQECKVVCPKNAIHYR